jgi:hypothetical protein
MSKRTHLALVRFIKVLHELGSIGLMGGVAVVMVVRSRAQLPEAPAYFELCHAIDVSYRWIIIPSLALCVFSGFASMMVHRPYWNALWAWLKGASGAVVLNICCRMQTMAHRATDAEYLRDRAQLADVFRGEWSGLWLLMILSLLNVVVGIYRPRFRQITGPD